jgi:hypothetical protein
MESFAEFVLPGQTTALNTLIVATAFAYSRVWNRRRLESLNYGFWNHFLFCLISSLARNLFLIPQLTLYNTPNPREFSNLSINTVAEKDAEECRPDFAIMGTKFRRRDDRKKGSNHSLFPNDFQQWDEIKIMAAEPFLFAELKTPPSRHIDNVDDFRALLLAIMRDATEQVEDQAALAFNDDVYKMDKIILIAACGEWWRFMIATRDVYERKAEYFFQEMEDEDDHDKVSYNAPARGNRAPQKNKSKGPGKLQSIRRHKDIGKEFMENVVNNIDNVMPDENVWSNNIRIGTPASNQRLYVIHRMLGEMRDQLAPPIVDCGSEVRKLLTLLAYRYR